MEKKVGRDFKDLGWLVAGAVVLWACGLAIHPNRSPELERDIFYAINGAPDLFYRPGWIFMQLGNLVVVPVTAAIAAVFRRFRLAGMILLAGAGKLYLARVVKDLVTRERPTSVVEDVIRRGADVSASGEAFVSGHAVLAFAIAMLAHPYLSRRWRIVAWSLAGAVCVGRVYVGAHLPLDVVGGAALGIAIGGLLNFVFGKPMPVPAEVTETQLVEAPVAARPSSA